MGSSRRRENDLPKAVFCQVFFSVNAEQPFLKRTTEGRGFLPVSKQTLPGGAEDGPGAAMEPEWAWPGFRSWSLCRAVALGLQGLRGTEPPLRLPVP